MAGDRSGRFGGRGHGIGSSSASAELQRELRALYEMYRKGEIPENVVRLIRQLEEAYWNARFAESGEKQPGWIRNPEFPDKPN